MKDTAMPTGRGFLPKTGAGHLGKIHRTETDPKAHARLLAYVMRKEGAPMRQIGGALNRPYSTVRGWLMRAMQMGTRGRHDERRPGAPPKLDGPQLGQLKKDLLAGSQGFGSGLWTARLLAVHIERRFGVRYGTSGIYEMLHRIGFSRQTPRPRHPKPASESERREFKKSKARRLVLLEGVRRRRPGRGVPHNRAGAEEDVGTTGRRGHGPVHAVEAEVLLVWRAAPGRVLPLVLLQGKRGQLHGLSRQAPQEVREGARPCGQRGLHKSRKVMKAVGGHGGDVVLRHFPAYTPDPSPAGGQWRNMRLHTANRLYGSAD